MSVFVKLKHYLRIGQFGSIIPGLIINDQPAPYPVLNERAIRASAGIIFAAGFFAFFHAVYLDDFVFLKFLAAFLFIDFFIKVLLGPHLSPISLLANYIVRNQKPEYVGAIQKRFAWSIGLVLSGIMLVLLFILSVSGLANLIICGVCLTFMFMESAFGICVGCKLYHALISYGLITKPIH